MRPVLSATEVSPERASPGEMAGKLMESQHRGRYLWAAQLVRDREVLDAGSGTGYGTEILAAAGARSVTGIDISQDAVDQARLSSSASGGEFALGDLQELALDDSAFDLVVCFEVIEHVDDPARVISELERVLRPTGVLVLSSPNRDVYPPGNPHHTHELVPSELEHLLDAFAHVRIYRQSAWLAAAVLDDRRSRAVGVDAREALDVVKVGSVAPGEEEFTIALASNATLPEVEPLVMMGKPFEVRWWEEQVNRAAGERDRERAQREREQAEHTRKRGEHADALLAVETDLAYARDEIARMLSTQDDVKEWALEQVQSIEASRDSYLARLAGAELAIADVTGSLSWRITAPLRAVMRLLRGLAGRG